MRRLVAATVMTLAACAPEDASFTVGDEPAVRALEEAYRTGWLTNDSAAVMATLAPGAVMMPAGVGPLIGDSAIRTYWWPNDGSQTTIDSYEITVDELEGSGDLAYLRGRASLKFTYRDTAGHISRLTSEAVHLSLARRGEDGKWQIARRVWSAIR